MKKLLTTVLLFAAVAALAQAPSVRYSGNRESRKFHRSSCRYYSCKACTIYFDSRDAAVRAGYSACGVCKP
jgi:hypothetical protein